MENQKGIIARFVIGRRFYSYSFVNSMSQHSDIHLNVFLTYSFFFLLSCSPNRGDSLDRAIDDENGQYNDFIIHVCFLNCYSGFASASKSFVSREIILENDTQSLLPE